jgi:hypothetical protein
MSDAAPKGRAFARSACWLYRTKWPSEAARFLLQFDPRVQQSVASGECPPVPEPEVVELEASELSIVQPGKKKKAPSLKSATLGRAGSKTHTLKTGAQSLEERVPASLPVCGAASVSPSTASVSSPCSASPAGSGSSETCSEDAAVGEAAAAAAAVAAAAAAAAKGEDMVETAEDEITLEAAVAAAAAAAAGKDKATPEASVSSSCSAPPGSECSKTCSEDAAVHKAAVTYSSSGIGEASLAAAAAGAGATTSFKAELQRKMAAAKKAGKQAAEEAVERNAEKVEPAAKKAGKDAAEEAKVEKLEPAAKKADKAPEAAEEAVERKVEGNVEPANVLKVASASERLARRRLNQVMAQRAEEARAEAAEAARDAEADKVQAENAELRLKVANLAHQHQRDNSQPQCLLLHQGQKQQHEEVAAEAKAAADKEKAVRRERRARQATRHEAATAEIESLKKQLRDAKTTVRNMHAIHHGMHKKAAAAAAAEAEEAAAAAAEAAEEAAAAVAAEAKEAAAAAAERIAELEDENGQAKADVFDADAMRQHRDIQFEILEVKMHIADAKAQAALSEAQARAAAAEARAAAAEQKAAEAEEDASFYQAAEAEEDTGGGSGSGGEKEGGAESSVSKFEGTETTMVLANGAPETTEVVLANGTRAMRLTIGIALAPRSQKATKGVAKIHCVADALSIITATVPSGQFFTAPDVAGVLKFFKFLAESEDTTKETKGIKDRLTGTKEIRAYPTTTLHSKQTDYPYVNIKNNATALGYTVDHLEWLEISPIQENGKGKCDLMLFCNHALDDLDGHEWTRVDFNTLPMPQLWNLYFEHNTLQSGTCTSSTAVPFQIGPPE